jgi:hypothetical protein
MWAPQSTISGDAVKAAEPRELVAEEHLLDDLLVAGAWAEAQVPLEALELDGDKPASSDKRQRSGSPW